MKRLICLCIALSMVLTLGAAAVTAASPADSGWSAYQDDYTGWDISGQTITGTFGTGSSNWLRKACLDDVKNFVLDVDISGNNTSSPYIKVLNNVIEVEGNNGNGEQVYVKIADQAKDWLAAAGTRVHIKVLRVDGGDLQIKLTGANNDRSVIYTAPVRSKDATVEIGMYRGIIRVENFTVGVPDADDLAEFEVEHLTPPDPDSYNYNVVDVQTDQPFSFKGNGAWDTETQWTFGQNETEGIWLQSDSADGPSAGAVYVFEKLGDNWLANCAVTPISTNNDGVATAQLRLMKKDKSDLARLILEYTEASGSVKLTFQARQEDNSWGTLWETEETAVEDKTFNLRMDRISDTEISLSVLGDCGYSLTHTVELTAETMSNISFFGLLSCRSVIRFHNFRVGATAIGRDYDEIAKQTYENLMKNFLDYDHQRLYPVFWGFKNGTVTNTGSTATFEGAGSVWEHTVMLMALDTYAQTLDPKSDEYGEIAVIITKTIKMLTDYYPENMITTAAVTPNWAMDDTGWTTMCLLLGYYYNKVLGNTKDSEMCYRYAKALFNSAYDTFYNHDLGGLCYTKEKTGLDLYAATLALAGYYINLIQPDAQVESRFNDIYNGMETLLRRPDGLYWMGVDENGTNSASNPYGIREGGSCTYIGGNMAMAVLNMLMGNEDKAYETVLGISRFESYNNGAFMNDRDAWNNTFFLGMFVREVMGKGVADGQIDRALYSTVTMVLQNACFDDGYYGASWSGPKEPSSLGYPSEGEYSTEGRNHWGVQYNNNGLNIGSTPNQIMTSATTAHVLLAAALNQKYDNTAAELVDLSVNGQTLWPAFNPGITAYTIQGQLEEATTIHLNPANNAIVSINGEVVTGDSVTVYGGLLNIQVTSGDGKSTRTYVIDLGAELPQPEDPNQTPETPDAPSQQKDTNPLDTNMILTIVLVAVTVVGGVVIVLELKKPKKTN